MVARARKGLGDLLKSEATRLDSKNTDSQFSESPKLQSYKHTESRTPEFTDSESPDLAVSESPELPKYLQLLRKETRLRADQYQELTVLARQLSRASAGRGERITENTLIRIAVDILLNQKETLQGATEEELLASVETDRI